MSLQWSSDLEIGIPVIDSQHQRIVEYINGVELAHQHHSQKELLVVLDELVDYTLSHFEFEESLIEEAGYPFTKAHKKVHALFTRRVQGYQQRAKAGEDVTEELTHTLKTWLVNHIKHDDRDYTGVVKDNMNEATKRVKAKSGSWMSRLFG
ncbi:bacteriohemerythrin [Aestuariicella hydrocarbonica]|uniref:Bacteriohemerythrin n=1 Tax=Pseudomaricurvus hydrocarbonicus TaxID=1470433 RepID=A0A9E5MPE3_9GAMM|nr:bacteriohemerythrin [Aestuariicella hydrocarbonica]NHO67945.1 bacteriohemerythrin [Aestuariicella hydrocarbonica]